MISIERYRSDPCGTLSIPYHKAKSVELPPGMMILHSDDFDPGDHPGFSDEPVFRLIHRLKNVEPPAGEAFEVRTAKEEDLALISEIIKRSYSDIGVASEELRLMRRSPVFDPQLWVVAYDRETGLPAACGIAELDREVGEGALEWIQTLPEFRRRGAARLVVLTLLSRLRERAGFVTVSGRANDPNSPEMLYRGCGFEGNDVWHVLRAKAPCTAEE